MTANEIYNRAIASLGYTDDQVFKNKAVVVVNQVYDDLFPMIKDLEYRPIKSLADRINLPERVASGIMVYGVAERFALGEGDGELQQYFARQYDKAKARLNRVDRVQIVL